MGLVYNFAQMTRRTSPQKSPDAFSEYSGTVGLHKYSCDGYSLFIICSPPQADPG